MDALELKKLLSGMALPQIVEVIEVLELELKERDLAAVAGELILARGMLLHRLYGEDWRGRVGG